jgi:hypothetical protein
MYLFKCNVNWTIEREKETSSFKKKQWDVSFCHHYYLTKGGRWCRPADNKNSHQVVTFMTFPLPFSSSSLLFYFFFVHDERYNIIVMAAGQTHTHNQPTQTSEFWGFECVCPFRLVHNDGNCLQKRNGGPQPFDNFLEEQKNMKLYKGMRRNKVSSI